jgi:hypothetical protein
MAGFAMGLWEIMQGVSSLPVLRWVKLMAPLLPLLLPVAGNCQTWQASGRPDLARFSAVDLQAHANQKRVNDLPTIHKLPGNNLAGLAAGKHELLGIAFQVGDGFLHLGSTWLEKLPEKIPIKIGRKFNTLHVLHAAAYAVNEDNATIASYTFHYEDGKSHSIAVANGKDVSSFWKRPGATRPTAAREAWVGSNDSAKVEGAKIRLFVSTWENPRPGSTVLRIDFVSAMTKAAPFCVAMTVAQPLRPRPPAKPLTAADLDRLWTALASTGRPCCAAVEALAGAPKQALPFLGPRVCPVGPTADVKKIAALITKLDNDKFAEREMAAAELATLGLEALPQLRRTMEESKSLEVQRRTQRLLERLNGISLTPDHKRLQAVLYVFELMASDGARKVLEELAGGKAGAWLGAEAAAALKRLEKPRPVKG